MKARRGHRDDGGTSKSSSFTIQHFRRSAVFDQLRFAMATALSEPPSITTSLEEDIAHFEEEGLSQKQARMMSTARRLQDRGQIDQAIVYYVMVLDESESEEARTNLRILMGLQAPQVQQVIREAVHNEDRRRLAETARLCLETRSEAEEEISRRWVEVKDAKSRLAEVLERARRQVEEVEEEEVDSTPTAKPTSATEDPTCRITEEDFLAGVTIHFNKVKDSFET
jgi:hypothetical protein